MSLHPGAGPTLVVALLVAFLGWRLAKAERKSIRNGLTLFLACIGLLALASGLRDAGFEATAGYVRGIALFAEGMALIYLAGVTLFRALFPLVRLTIPRIIQDVVFAAAWIVWTAIWLRMNHVDLTSIVATSAVVTAVIAFSLQDTLGNILGGIAIQLDRSIHVGDWVEVDGVVGRVAEVRWRYTSLETRDWETVIVPNSQLVKNRFRVLGRRHGEPTRLRRTVRFNVDYRYSPASVIEAVETAIRSARIQRLAHTPTPECLMMAFEDSYGRYAVRYWLDDLTSDEPTDSDVRQTIYFALQRIGVRPSIPAQAVFVTHETEARRQDKEARNQRQRAEALEKIDLFEALQPDEVEQLASRLEHAPFAHGSVITRQGEQADCLYLICDGWAEVLVQGEDGQTTRVAELGPGSFLGEMALMTGEPRSATVVARTNVQAYRLRKGAFKEVLRSRPTLVQEVSSVLARRRTELEAARENLDTEARGRRLQSTRSALLQSIQSFFGLDAD